MDEQIPMPLPVRQYLESKMIGKNISEWTIKDVLGSGNTAITYEVEDKYGIKSALKLVTRESYGERAPFREIGRFSRVEDERFLVFPKEVGDWSLEYRHKKTDFIWFRSRCVKGVTLKKFLESNTQFITSIEISRYIEDITVALEELQRLEFMHGDLHDRNIMREEIGTSGPLPEIRYVIIDFSEAHSIDATQEGLSKDMEYFGCHLRSFSDAIYRKETLSRDDEIYLSAVTHLPGLLSGTAPESMGISKPSIILERFKEALRTAEETSIKLRTPFDSLSTEYIANDALLADLCYTNAPWVSDLEAHKNVLLIGPRGCGKTMIFRRLRLKTKSAVLKTNKAKKMMKEIMADPYIGFYLPCESLFYMRFADLSEATVEDNKCYLILFFNMAILAEVSSTLAALPDFVGHLSPNIAEALKKLLKEEVGEIWEELKIPDIITCLDEIVLYAETIMRKIRKDIAYKNRIASQGSTDFLSRLVETVKREIPSISGRYFTFFLDDYTEERVPLALQEALHPIVCQRSAELCFKISAHMFGSIYNSPRPLSLDEGRNIMIINIGSAYLKLNKRKREGQLLLEILNERFRNCENYEGDIKGWLGNRCYPDGKTLSQALHDEKIRPNTHYHGVQSIVDLCTGDYSEMIRMVGEIFLEAGIKPNTPISEISPAIQDKAIDRVSREYLGRIRHIRPDGMKLYDIVNSFGTLSRRLLYERELIGQGVNSKGEKRQDPYDLLTIFGYYSGSPTTEPQLTGE